jgi:hypothetical protein
MINIMRNLRALSNLIISGYELKSFEHCHIKGIFGMNHLSTIENQRNIITNSENFLCECALHNKFHLISDILRNFFHHRRSFIFSSNQAIVNESRCQSLFQFSWIERTRRICRRIPLKIIHRKIDK